MSTRHIRAKSSLTNCHVRCFVDLPRRISALQWVSWLMAAVGVFMVLLAHGHYTIDVLIAYYITTRLFWTYHTLTNNAFLIKVRTISVITEQNARLLFQIIKSISNGIEKKKLIKYFPFFP